MQRSSPTVADESLRRMWERCRLVGLINNICCCITIFFIVLLLLGAFIIIPYCHHSADKSNKYCIKLNNKSVFRVFIFLCCCLVVPIQLIYVNNYLRSTNMPADRNKLKVWLRDYKFLLGLSVLWFLVILFHPAEMLSQLSVGISGCSIMVISIQVYTVGNFNKEYRHSTAGCI